MIIYSLCLITVCFLRDAWAVKYSPTWESLDSRPLPQWYDDAKFGIFLHLGVWSVPGYGNMFWPRWQDGEADVVAFMKENYSPSLTYGDLAPLFTMDLFNATRWATIFKRARAKYVVLTTKHHEGFTNWPSAYSWNWNARDVGPGRDIVREFVDATRASKLHVGLYHSLFEWYNPLFQLDAANQYKTQLYVQAKPLACLRELVDTYLPDLIWSDGDWMVGSSYWNATSFLAWLYNESPVRHNIVVNDRWGSDARCHHGGFWNCDDDYQPTTLPKHKWERCVPLDTTSWVYRRSMNLAMLHSTQQILKILVYTVSYGGNLLLNVGPRSDGWIDTAFEQRLTEVGDWLQVNGQAVFRSRAWTYQNDSLTPSVFYTTRKGSNAVPLVYAFITDWPSNSLLQLAAPRPTSETQVTLIGWKGRLKISVHDCFIVINLPLITPANLPCDACRYSQVLKFTNLANACPSG